MFDWAQHSAFGNILIIVDSCSSWIEVVQCTDRSTATVQCCLLEIFSQFGVPRTLVSDNGPEFVALKPWLLRMNCRKLEMPAYKPSSNGTAEHATQTIKCAIAGYMPAMSSRDCYLLHILFNHHIASELASHLLPPNSSAYHQDQPSTHSSKLANLFSIVATP